MLRVPFKVSNTVDLGEFFTKLSAYLGKEGVLLGTHDLKENLKGGTIEHYLLNGVGITVKAYSGNVSRTVKLEVELVSDATPVHGLYEKIQKIANESGKTKLV